MGHCTKNGVELSFILLCETFLHDGHSNIFELPGYNLVHTNRINRSRGGVVIYVKSDIEYKIRDDISIFDEGEFESIFIETNSCTAVNTVIGEIYRIPNSNPNLSVKRYEHIFTKLKKNAQM